MSRARRQSCAHAVMLKLLLCLCLIGLSSNAVLASNEKDDLYDFYGDKSEELPTYVEQDKPVKHQVEQLKSDENLFDEIEQFKHDNQLNLNMPSDGIGDYQVEDNRSEEDIKQDENNDDEVFKLLSGDPDLAPVDDLDKPISEDEGIKSTENENDHDEFEEAINSYLDNIKEDTSKNDILEETKAILKEDAGNDLKEIPPLNIKDITDETGKLLNETDDSFDENSQNTQTTASKIIKGEESDNSEDQGFDDLMTDLDKLHATWNMLSNDYVDKFNEETNLGYDDNYENADNQDYEEINDDDLDRIFIDKSKEKQYDDEPFRDDSPVESKEKEQMVYLNDALSASDSTQSKTNVITTTTDAVTTDVSDSDSDITQTQGETETPKEEVQTDKSTSPIIELTKVSTSETTQDDNKESTLEMPELTQLDSKDKDEFYEKYKYERNAHASATNTIQVHLNINDSTVVASPNYPKPYPTDQITDYVITGDGLGIEMNVTDFSINGFVGDYLLVIPGQTEDKGSEGILFSYSLRSERRFRFTDVDRMFIRFEARPGMQFQRGFNISLRNIMLRSDVVVLPDEDEVITWTSNATLTVNLGGVSINSFISKEDDFRRIIADMATMYINAKGIERGLNTTLEVTQIRSTGLCFQNWPGSDECTEVTFSVPLVYDDEDLETRLTKEDLRDMWDSYSSIDPFAVRLELLGIREFTYPDDKTTLTVWLVIAAGVIISMAMLAFALWRFSCFEEYTKMPSYSDTDSLNEKRVLDLYPTPHQTLPPLYTEDNIKWADEVYNPKDIGFSNKSYMRDIYDIDSDDEALRAPDRRYTTDV